jgi:hypothetical protein
MFDNGNDLNLEQELSEIPPEYQDAFRQALEQELAEAEQNRTDTDILNYLRRRRDDFKGGSFIRPDGRPGLVALNSEALYEQALPALARSSAGEDADPAERRRTLMKLGIFAAIALLFLLFAVRGRAQREAERKVVEAGAPTAEPSAAVGAIGATATPALPLPVITSVDESLQTIGGLGGALTIGRPSAIELAYGRTEETVALAIDPSKPTPRGELRYNEATMRSGKPVAVWLFGTVLNYAVGIPDSLVRNLAPGDRITLSTDTGASLRFVVAETWQGHSYEAGRLLSQNRLGLTLFALPAAAENDVSFAFAHYDVTSEEERAQVTYGVGETLSGAAGSELRLTDVHFSHTATGELRIVASGDISRPVSGQVVMLSLTAGSEQTTAVPLAPDETGAWQTAFVVPGSVTGLPLFAEFRTLPEGGLSVVGLGEAPHLIDHLDIAITAAWWDAAAAQAVVTVSTHNPGQGAVHLGPDFIRLLNEGGDAYESAGQVTPRLPLLIGPGETVGIVVPFSPLRASMRLQLGADLWEIRFPDETHLPTGRQP